ncbi:hypothetical protein CKY20_05205 [Capnocytophaga canis]|uniref:Efflux transporter, outer membrane factor lipoprotein, NodT family n=2 Tax=Capnocytophaga canis TaxID=1848903 RepID=A0A3A1YGW8_9FLAO|nr:efflux transporter outer membrane subunit [Capnocytophaga canis]RIY36925.1 hypothetical protein CKY20_05205 [Capnocytophaga canis]
MKQQIKKGIIALGGLLILASCAGRKPYIRTELPTENLYRTDQLPTDSISTGSVSWRTIFTDDKLQGYIEQALEHNLDIRIAWQNMEKSKAQLLQSKYAFLPTLSLNPSYTYTSPSLNTPSGNFSGERTHLRQWDLTATTAWEADIWGKINAQKKANYAGALSSIASHQAIQSEVVATLATAYYQLLMLDKQQQILEATISLRLKSLETTQALKQAGSTTEVAVQQTQALYYNAQAQLVGIKNNIHALENSICILLGIPSQPIARNSLEGQSFPTDFNQGYAVSLLENRPDVRKAELDLIQAFELTNVARAAFYPTFTITARGGFSSQTFENWLDTKSIFANFIGGLVQPLLNKRQIRSQYEISQANRETALLKFKKTMLTAGKEVSDALQNYHSQHEYILLKTKEMEAYQKATEYSQELFNSGMASYLEVISAEVNRLNAELSVANAEFNKMQYGIMLYKALGGGWK